MLQTKHCETIRKRYKKKKMLERYVNAYPPIGQEIQNDFSAIETIGDEVLSKNGVNRQRRR